MRIWSLHPGYLDAKGLVALWRETLLAKNVLEGKTKGYKNHPQLIRFKNTIQPLNALNFERNHLLKKLKLRNQKVYNKLRLLDDFETHPLFHLIKGEIESWEKT